MVLFLESGDPSLHVIAGEPAVMLFIEPDNRMGLRIVTADLPDLESPLAEVQVVARREGGQSGCEVSTSNRGLFPYFYSFAISLADRIQVDRIPPIAALKESLHQWRSLLRQAAMLSDERQLGLMGELWFLLYLYDARIEHPLATWTGPRGQAHDFRIENREFEVKTTRMETRLHSISSMTQLLPSPDHHLYLLSIQFAAAGVGMGVSLEEQIGLVRERSKGTPEAEDFDEILTGSFGISGESEKYYRTKMILRTRPALIPITEDFPRILPQDVYSIARSGMDRIDDVRYRLDVEGLGILEDSPEFSRILRS